MLARGREKKILPRAYTKVVKNRPLCHALEIRHESYRLPEFIELLREQNVGLVCADTVEWPRLMDLTSDFVYCRLHGSEVLYASGYDQRSIDAWTKRAVAWVSGTEPKDAERVIESPAPKRATRDVYAYLTMMQR